MHGYLLIDGPSIGHAANAGATLTVGSTQVQAIYGFMRTMHSIVKTYPTLRPIVLWDGASWRKMLLTSYKEIRDKTDTPSARKAQEAKSQFKKQVPAIRKGLELLGVPQVFALNMEADDLAAILTDKYTALGHKILLCTGDQDWIQLIGPGVMWFNPINHQKIGHAKITEKNLEEMTGAKNVRQFVERKALSGDKGDSVPGVGGIGEPGAIEFLQKYGTIADFINGVLLDKTIPFDTLPKKFKALIEDETKIAAFNRNLALMDLRTPARPDPINFTVTRGTPDQARFATYCQKLMFRSITKDLDGFLSVFPAFTAQAAA